MAQGRRSLRLHLPDFGQHCDGSGRGKTGGGLAFCCAGRPPGRLLRLHIGRCEDDLESKGRHYLQGDGRIPEGRLVLGGHLGPDGLTCGEEGDFKPYIEDSSCLFLSLSFFHLRTRVSYSSACNYHHHYHCTSLKLLTFDPADQQDLI
jgi:hypothetical protein